MADTEYQSLLRATVENERARIYGKYRGTVSDVDDPDGLARIKATVPAVYGDQDSPWALPCSPFAGASHGLVLLPEVGDGVWIEFEGGSISRPIWSGCWWSSDQRPEPKGATIRLLATTAGHQIVIDEDADEIKLVHPGGAEFTIGASEIVLKLGSCEIKMSQTEIVLNNGMVKVTTAGASL